MTKLDDFSKIIVGGNEIGKVLHRGKTIWQDVYLAQDSDFVNVNGYWIYRGTQSRVEIPTRINGQLVTSTRYMFCKSSPYNSTLVTKVVLKHSNVTDMSNTFYSYWRTTLDLSDFNTSNVTDMSNMFFDCRVTTLDLSSFNTSRVTNTTKMFYFAKTTAGYARTQADANKFNASSDKPAGLTFRVK